MCLFPTLLMVTGGSLTPSDIFPHPSLGILKLGRLVSAGALLIAYIYIYIQVYVSMSLHASACVCGSWPSCSFFAALSVLPEKVVRQNAGEC